MGWLSNIFKKEGESKPSSGSAEDVVRFYQQLDLFAGKKAADVLAKYAEEFGGSLNPNKPWDDVFLLSHSKETVWSSDPEADVCAENKVYTEVLEEWSGISSGAFRPTEIREQWESASGPVRLGFKLNARSVTVTPEYLDDWIDLDVLKQINRQIESSGRQFAFTIDGSFCVAVCLTREQKEQMWQARQFPFAW